MNPRSKAWLPLALGALAFAPAALADDASGPVTFTKDVLPILQANCQGCHRPSGVNLSGMVAPMSFMSYDETRPWAKSMAREVSAKNMPPWFASSEFKGVFELERGLTDQEIATIETWAASGAQRGNPDDAPAPVVFPSAEGWTMGEPDLVVTIPEPFWVGDDVEDLQPSFTVTLTEEQLPEDRWIAWTEFRPGSNIVHHGGASLIPVGPDGKPVKDPISGGKIIGTAQGDGPDVWPEGYGKLMRKGTQIRFGIHYNKEPGPGTGVWDKSMIAIKFQDKDKPVKHIVRSMAVNSYGWEIPPYKGEWKVGAARKFDVDSVIVNLMPHMHFRGQAAKYEAFYPDGTREVLLDVPRDDFRWQLTYTYKEPKDMPAGTRLEVTMLFDNSKDNEYVVDPERAIGWGGMTKDEMNNGWLEFANAVPVDDWRAIELGQAANPLDGLDDSDVQD